MTVANGGQRLMRHGKRVTKVCGMERGIGVPSVVERRALNHVHEKHCRTKEKDVHDVYDANDGRQRAKRHFDGGVVPAKEGNEGGKKDNKKISKEPEGKHEDDA